MGRKDSWKKKDARILLERTNILRQIIEERFADKIVSERA